MFPLALGVDLSNSLALEQELRDLKRRLRPLEADLELRARTRERWLGDARGLWWRAREFGLIATEAIPPESLDGITADLRRLLTESQDPLPRPGAAAQAGEHFAVLRSRESEVSSRIRSLKLRLQRLGSLSGAAGDYGNGLREQQGRLGGLGWFEKHIGGTAYCSVCGSEQDSARHELTRLKKLASDLGRETEALARTPVVVDKERSEVSEQLADLEEQHRQIRRERIQAEDNHQTRDGGTRLEDVHRFLGWLEKFLEDQTGSEDDADLAVKVAGMRHRLSAIERQLAGDARKGRLATALKKVSAGITEHARFLRLERADEWIELKINSLNLQFTDQTRNRRDVLSDLGSGENWMGYHLATFLALHNHFAKQTHSPVANFLVIDQPSQVYFPAQILDEHAENNSRVLKDKDKQATRRIFEALSRGIESIDKGFQIIVTEHADEDIWGGIEQVELVDRWRGERDYLVPRDWLA